MCSPHIPNTGLYLPFVLLNLLGKYQFFCFSTASVLNATIVLELTLVRTQIPSLLRVDGSRGIKESKVRMILGRIGEV